jgi:hypothetical protein
MAVNHKDRRDSRDPELLYQDIKRYQKRYGMTITMAADMADKMFRATVNGKRNESIQEIVK